MLVKECYAVFGGNYEDVLARLTNDNIISKFIIMFLKDPSYTNLKECLERKDYEEAFRAVHSLKGICRNLSFPRLEESSSALTEVLRNGLKDDTDVDKCNVIFEQLTKDYFEVYRAITRYKELL